MKPYLLAVGVVCLLACFISFLLSAFNRLGYYRVLDGKAELYARLRRRMTLFFSFGFALLLVGAVCLIIGLYIL